MYLAKSETARFNPTLFISLRNEISASKLLIGAKSCFGSHEEKKISSVKSEESNFFIEFKNLKFKTLIPYGSFWETS
jgi:hypothetical protein